MNPEFVIITGDFVHDHKDSTQWAEFNRITGMIKKSVSVYMIPGNHEFSQNPTEKEFSDYKKIYGDDKFSFRHKKNLFIGINSFLLKTDSQKLEESQFQWLESELKSAKNVRNIVIFSHHPFFLKDPKEKETYSNIGLEKRERYFELFEKFNVKAIFAGHFHKNSFGEYEGMPMVTTSAVGKQLGDDLPGLRLVKVTKDSVLSAYYSLDEIGSLVDFSDIDGF